MYFLIIAAAFAIDQLTKTAVFNIIGIGGVPVKVIEGFFYITCHRNSGAAWGVFQGGRYPLILLTFVALLFIGYAMIKVKDRLFRILTAVFIGGTLGNLFDRIIHGSVVDLLDFFIFGYNFPTFNAADVFIVLGTISLAIYLAINKEILAQFDKRADMKEPEREQNEPEREQNEPEREQNEPEHEQKETEQPE